MKKVVVILFCVCLIVFVVSCGGDSPTDVTKNFLQAYINYDIEALPKYATPETVELLSGILELAIEQESEPTITNLDAFTFAETIDGDTASVALTMDGEAAGSVDLVKVDGKWLVSASK
jgi:hypothetical protein